MNEDDFETFVWIIRRATCNMDAYELGLDPRSDRPYPRLSDLAVEDPAETRDVGVRGYKNESPNPGLRSMSYLRMPGEPPDNCLSRRS
jgi:hypothetical protein